MASTLSMERKFFVNPLNFDNMKKIYIIPSTKTTHVEVAGILLANSLEYKRTTNAIDNGGVDDSDATNGADGLVREGTNFWEEW